MLFLAIYWVFFENKMAASDAILNSMKIKLGTSIDNVNVIANLNFEDIQSINVIFVNFLVFYKNKMAATAAILDPISIKNDKCKHFMNTINLTKFQFA